ncbi:hypothetical protein HK104_003035, partial [Borealophlyctis nickersoniae]
EGGDGDDEGVNPPEAVEKSPEPQEEWSHQVVALSPTFDLTDPAQRVEALLHFYALRDKIADYHDYFCRHVPRKLAVDAEANMWTGRPPSPSESDVPSEFVPEWSLSPQ